MPDAMGPPPRAPYLWAEGQGLRPSLHQCSQWGGDESFLATQADASDAGAQTQTHGNSSNPVARRRRDPPENITNWGVGGRNRGEDPIPGARDRVWDQGNTLRRRLCPSCRLGQTRSRVTREVVKAGKAGQAGRGERLHL